MLEEFIHDYETNWLDESIPALDGHTPRQAAADPTRRADLIRLLDCFPAGAAPGRHGCRPAARGARAWRANDGRQCRIRVRAAARAVNGSL